MSDAGWDHRLSRISTQWTLMFQAHDQQAGSAGALGEVLRRYTGAVYRYLLGAVRDADIAEELAQEFALRFLRGDFHRARPERGRFRNYLKTALVNLVNDHHRKRQAAPGRLPADTPDRGIQADSDSENDFVASWRAEVLQRTWQALADTNASYHTALLLRIQNPDMQSPELAAQLGVQLNKEISAPLARKTIQRAQEKFAELLLDEVTSTLETPALEDVQEELQALDLVRYCKSVLERRAGQKGEPEA